MKFISTFLYHHDLSIHEHFDLLEKLILPYFANHIANEIFL